MHIFVYLQCYILNLMKVSKFFEDLLSYKARVLKEKKFPFNYGPYIWLECVNPQIYSYQICTYNFLTSMESAVKQSFCNVFAQPLIN